jgi:HEAT repeat protein
MYRAKLNLLFGGATLFAIVVSLLLYLGIPNLASAQAGSNSTPTLTPEPTTAPTTIAAQTQPQPTSTPDTVSYKDLVEHFERVTDLTLRIIGTVVTLLGILGIVAGYFSLKTVRDLEKLVDSVEKKVAGIEQNVQDMQREVNMSKMQATALTNWYRTMVEVRDRNPEVRIRAVQQLGASNDIAAVSMLVELLMTDAATDVRIEAAYGLGQLLIGGGEPKMLAEGVQALVEATKDESNKVRREAVEALDTIICSNVQLPRAAVQRLREIVEHDKFADVIKAAEIALKHIQEQRESHLKSKGEEATTV